MSDLYEAWQRVGQVLQGAFNANDPPMRDWAQIEFLVKGEAERRIEELEAENKRLRQALEKALEQPND